MPVDQNAIKILVHKGIKSSRSLEGFMRNAAQAKLKAAKQAFLEEFHNHNVTQEIAQGPNATNISGTLDGEGNLFSFIGFDQYTTNPAEAMENILEGRFDLEPYAKVRGNATQTVFEFAVEMLSEDDFEGYEAARMPWEGGTWLYNISRGISGFGHYIYSSKLDTPRSRSGTGLQIENEVRESEFTPVSYFEDMYERFKDKLRE